MSASPAHPATAALLGKVLEGRRISEAEALELYRSADLLSLGAAAHAVRNRHNPPDRVSYVIDRNVNYTDICDISCTFCAFHRRPGDPEGYVLTREELRTKAEETLALGGTGFLLQGGVNPDLPWRFIFLPSSPYPPFLLSPFLPSHSLPLSSPPSFPFPLSPLYPTIFPSPIP